MHVCIVTNLRCFCAIHSSYTHSPMGAKYMLKVEKIKIMLKIHSNSEWICVIQEALNTFLLEEQVIERVKWKESWFYEFTSRRNKWRNIWIIYLIRYNDRIYRGLSRVFGREVAGWRTCEDSYELSTFRRPTTLKTCFYCYFLLSLTKPQYYSVKIERSVYSEIIFRVTSDGYRKLSPKTFS